MAYPSNEPQSIPTLFDALQTETVDTLKEQANLISGSEQTRLVRKANLIEFIRQCMVGENLQALWQRLDTLQQAAVAETAHGPNPWFDADRFIAKYGRLPDPGPAHEWIYPRQYSLIDLFFFDEIMPEDLRQRVKSFTPKPEPARLSPLSEIPGEWALLYEEWDQAAKKKKVYRNMVPITCRLTERSAIHDLKAVLRLIDAGKLAVSDKTRQPGGAGLKAMTPLLLGGDFYDDSGYGDDQKKRGLTAVAKRRAAINQVLKHCPPGQWIAVNDRFRFMRVNGPKFEITRDLESRYVNEPMNDMDSIHCPDWMLL